MDEDDSEVDDDDLESDDDDLSDEDEGLCSSEFPLFCREAASQPNRFRTFPDGVH